MDVSLGNILVSTIVHYSNSVSHLSVTHRYHHFQLWIVIAPWHWFLADCLEWGMKNHTRNQQRLIWQSRWISSMQFCHLRAVWGISRVCYSRVTGSLQCSLSFATHSLWSDNIHCRITRAMWDISSVWRGGVNWSINNSLSFCARDLLDAAFGVIFVTIFTWSVDNNVCLLKYECRFLDPPLFQASFVWVFNGSWIGVLQLFQDFLLNFASYDMLHDLFLYFWVVLCFLFWSMI